MVREAISRKKLGELRAEFESSPGDYITLYMKPTSFPDYLNEISLSPRYSTCLEEIKELASSKPVTHENEKYKTGAAIFWQQSGNKYILLPPFPISENRIITGHPDVSLLRETLETKYFVGAVLVAWGSYAVGIFHGDSLLESKVGTGHIHKKHKKGGSSQKRFARRTEEQRRDFLRRVGNRVDERFAHHTLDYIFFGGNRLILKPLSKESRQLETEAAKISARILDVRYANKKALDYSLEQINTSFAFRY